MDLPTTNASPSRVAQPLQVAPSGGGVVVPTNGDSQPAAPVGAFAGLLAEAMAIVPSADEPPGDEDTGASLVEGPGMEIAAEAGSLLSLMQPALPVVAQRDMASPRTVRAPATPGTGDGMGVAPAVPQIGVGVAAGVSASVTGIAAGMKDDAGGATLTFAPAPLTAQSGSAEAGTEGGAAPLPAVGSPATQPGRNAAEQLADNAAEQLADNAAEQLADSAAEQPTHHPADQPTQSAVAQITASATPLPSETLAEPPTLPGVASAATPTVGMPAAMPQSLTAGMPGQGAPAAMAAAASSKPPLSSAIAQLATPGAAVTVQWTTPRPKAPPGPAMSAGSADASRPAEAMALTPQPDTEAALLLRAVAPFPEAKPTEAPAPAPDSTATADASAAISAPAAASTSEAAEPNAPPQRIDQATSAPIATATTMAQPPSWSPVPRLGTPFVMPARQIASFAVAMAMGPDATLTVTLDPVELGRVEVSIERTGTEAAIRVMAERPETLALLQRDSRELERALSDAGLSGGGTSLSFSLGGGDSASQESRQLALRRGAGGPAAPGAGTHVPPPPSHVATHRGVLDLAL